MRFSRPSVSPQPGVRMWSSRRWIVSRWASPFLSLSHLRKCANSLVEFAPDYLYPSPEARDTIYFGLDDVLLTAASDSEDFGPALADAFPPGGQESRPTPSSWTCFPAPLRSSLWIGPMSPASLSRRSSTSGSLAARSLLPLSHFFHEWERLPGVSLWVLCTVRSGNTLQFG